MPTINTVILQKNAGEADADHAVRVMGVATQLNNELGDVLENLRARTVELAAVNSQKKSWMIGASLAIFLFFLALIGALLLSVRSTQGDMDNAVKRESDKVVVANTALQACQVSKSTCTVAQSAAQPDSYGRDRDTGILLERSAQSDKKLDVLVARPQPNLLLGGSRQAPKASKPPAVMGSGSGASVPVPCTATSLGVSLKTFPEKDFPGRTCAQVQQAFAVKFNAECKGKVDRATEIVCGKNLSGF